MRSLGLKIQSVIKLLQWKLRDHYIARYSRLCLLCRLSSIGTSDMPLVQSVAAATPCSSTRFLPWFPSTAVPQYSRQRKPSHRSHDGSFRHCRRRQHSCPIPLTFLASPCHPSTSFFRALAPAHTSSRYHLHFRIHFRKRSPLLETHLTISSFPRSGSPCCL